MIGRGARFDLSKEGTADLTSAALALSWAPGTPYWFYGVLLRASEVITETVTVTFTSGTSANYSTVLDTVALVAGQNYGYWVPESGRQLLRAGDSILVACTNGTTTGSVYVTMFGEKM